MPAAPPTPDPPEAAGRSRPFASGGWRGEAFRVGATLAGWGAFAFTCLLWGAFVIPPTLVMERIRPSARERFHDLTRAALRIYVGTLPFMRLRVEGIDARAGGSRILVANHQSWLDPIVMLSLEPRLSGPARSYNFRVPILRTILRLMGFHRADSGEPPSLERLREAAELAIRRGGGLLFFPEGTRSRTGEIGPFHRGAFRAAVDHELPIQPVLIEGLHRLLPPGHLFVRTPRRAPVTVRYLEPVTPPYGTGVRRDVVRALAARVRERMVDELAQMRDAGEPG